MRRHNSRGHAPFATGLLLLLTALLAVPTAMAANDSQGLYAQGQRYFTLGDYHKAAHSLKAAVKLAPDNADYHHWLGMTYGRMAEKANWFEALSLSRKTLHELRTAVTLDKNDVGALQDLMEYYRQAPAFLGGSQRKAADIARRLEVLNAAGVTQEASRKFANSPS
jgi:cytochrome c-type biogenesis protein CcmH/NrfG